AANPLQISILKTMLRLSKRSGLCPQCLIIKNVEKLEDYPVGGDGFGDVRKGKIGEQTVCLKIVKLNHPNVLPFMGLHCMNNAQTQLCLVSPWMEQENLVQFLKAISPEQIDHYTLVYDVDSGLSYLHSEKVIHGDLKGLSQILYITNPLTDQYKTS
ncbi:hypothetical protein L218DRAFT_887452, partial [Marasmius fiardii PR-910]